MSLHFGSFLLVCVLLLFIYLFLIKKKKIPNMQQM